MNNHCFCRCRTNYIIFFVISAVLAVTTALSNLTVLIVFCTNKKLINGQAVYRISLAISDVFTGIIVFPSFIISSFRHLNNLEDIHLKNDFYVDAIGFFTMLTLHVSIFTLTAGVIDRFKVVYRPLSYNVQSSISFGWKICVVLWTISIILSALPLGIFGTSFRYSIQISILSIPVFVIFNFTNPGITYLYFWCIYLISFLVMWIFTIMTFVFYKKSSKKIQSIISTQAQKREMKKQIRLLFTLGIMVGTFSLCFLPLVLLEILGFIFPVSLKKNFVVVSTCYMVFATSNSLWNFFIYNARDKAFRSTSKRLYKKLLCCLK